MTSLRTVPLLFLNLGGEMMYILDQRLTAQNIPKDKALKVMNDIGGIMFNERFLRELFKPLEAYNKLALRKLFEDLVHSSIMRLNKASMDKLYDLMTMAFKYQVFMASRPVDLILITLNHLDAVRNFISAPAIQKQIDTTYRMIMDTYGSLSVGELQTIRYSLLNFFQDLKVRVSVFLRHGVQADDGKFYIPNSGPVPSGCEVPGCIRTYDWNGEVRQVRRFPSGGNYTGAEESGSLELHGNRVTKLGSNIYKDYPTIGRASPAPKRRVPEGSHNVAPPEVSYEHADILAVQEELNLGQEELNLLMAQLLGNHVGHERKLIHLNLVNADREEEDNGQQQHGSCGEIISIDASKQPRSAVLEKVYGEMTIETEEPANVPEDILEILDSLS
ncbi:protein OSCP1 [Anabrus simplex]|uniref:protein OSCP1 n=1 Tax=Anabrus simplex TaxID=316456 RepID=UPI0035A3C790